MFETSHAAVFALCPEINLIFETKPNTVVQIRLGTSFGTFQDRLNI
jgi:hypothetical protein